MIIVNGKGDYCQFKVELKTSVDIKYKQKKRMECFKALHPFFEKSNG